MKACNRKILELFYNAKHTGRISKPDAIGRVGEDDEGLVIELTWRVIGGVIAEAKFRAFANPNAIAITSLMVDNMIGKSVEDVLSLGESVIIDNLGEFLPEYLEVYDMVRECIAEAYNNYLKRQSRTTTAEVQEFNYEEYRLAHEVEDEEDDGFDFIKFQKELDGEKVETEKRGRGRPRKPVDPNAVVEVGEKRGRGRPRKEVDPNAIVEVGEKRGRGRPRKEIDPNTIVEVGEKRGRGRPRKPVDPNAVVEIGEKRGRGRPRKEVDPNAIVEVGEKRGRGRPRKEVDPNAVVEVGEKRGRGRPRKEVDPNQVVEVGEKRGRGRPRKEITFSLPTDLDDVIDDEEIEQLISGESSQTKQETEMSSRDEIVSTNSLLDEDDDTFEANYDLFKSNIRNILTGKESNNKSYNSTIVANNIVQDQKIDQIIENNATEEQLIVENNTTEQTKRGRGRPRKEIDPNIVIDEGEKRGRGRPKKIVIEEVEDESEKRGRGRPRLQPINSLTRSLTPNSMPAHTNQDIVFASKNVTTTNININVTKSTTSIEDNKATSNDYTHNTTITKQKVEVTLPNTADKDEEIEIEPNKLDTINTFKDFDDDDDEIDVSNIKDEAPAGGIEDLLKALLDD